MLSPEASYLPTSPEAWQELLKYATKEEQARLVRLLNSGKRPWYPLPGPQTSACESEADVIGYGGAAGGGKTDLVCGLALTEHHRSQIFRREGTELSGIFDRLTDLVGHTDGYNGSNRIWKFPQKMRKQIEFCSAPNPGDERKYRGRPKDFLAIDEAPEFLESQVRFIMGWVRHESSRQRRRTLLTFNPPETVEGRWILDFFGPWLKPNHPDRAVPGELRWFTTLNGQEVEVPDGDPFSWTENGRTEIITPKSRTFFPARVQDNPYYMESGYVSQLQALPEPLRSQLLYGDFAAGVSDDPQQVIPTEWVEAAMDRWKPLSPRPPMDSMGVDVARGGKDSTIISTRHGQWYAPLIEAEGKDTPDGPSVAGGVVAARRNNAPVHIDAIGVGASPLDFLRQAKVQTVPVMGNETAPEATDRTGLLRFSNVRSWMWWKMREELDPQHDTGIMLPKDDRLLAELCAPKWTAKNRVIYVMSRDEIIAKIGRSPDRATAVCLARMETMKISAELEVRERMRKGAHLDPASRLLHELKMRAKR